jgi:hypothetical protein
VVKEVRQEHENFEVRTARRYDSPVTDGPARPKTRRRQD